MRATGLSQLVLAIPSPRLEACADSNLRLKRGHIGARWPCLGDRMVSGQDGLRGDSYMGPLLSGPVFSRVIA